MCWKSQKSKYRFFWFYFEVTLWSNISSCIGALWTRSKLSNHEIYCLKDAGVRSKFPKYQNLKNEMRVGYQFTDTCFMNDKILMCKVWKSISSARFIVIMLLFCIFRHHHALKRSGSERTHSGRINILYLIINLLNNKKTSNFRFFAFFIFLIFRFFLLFSDFLDLKDFELEI